MMEEQRPDSRSRKLRIHVLKHKHKGGKANLEYSVNS